MNFLIKNAHTDTVHLHMGAEVSKVDVQFHLTSATATAFSYSFIVRTLCSVLKRPDIALQCRATSKERNNIL